MSCAVKIAASGSRPAGENRKAPRDEPQLRCHSRRYPSAICADENFLPYTLRCSAFFPEYDPAPPEEMPLRFLLIVAVLLSCDPEPSEASVDEYDVTLPEDCPAYQFQDFQEPYGVLLCEVYIGCFGSYGSRESGAQAETVEQCLELSCGGATGLDGEVECVLDEERADGCIASMAAIADDVEGSCPDVDDAWFPPDCELAIECADS